MLGPGIRRRAMYVAITMISAAAIIMARAPESHWNFKLPLRPHRFGHQTDADGDRCGAGGQPGRIAHCVPSGAPHRARRISLLFVRAGVDFLQRALRSVGLQNLPHRPHGHYRNQALDDLVTLAVQGGPPVVYPALSNHSSMFRAASEIPQT